MPELIAHVAAKGDLTHVVLTSWAATTTGLLFWTMKELASANRRFDAFVRELARFNARFEEDL